MPLPAFFTYGKLVISGFKDKKSDFVEEVKSRG
jgi:hypothetical protein